MVTEEQEDEGQMVADMIRARAEERAAAALASADAALNAPRPWPGGGDGWGREGEGATVPQSPAPSRAAPAPSRPMPPAPVADDDLAPVKKGVLIQLLQAVIREERVRAAQIIGKLEERIAMLEARSSKKGKANGAR